MMTDPEGILISNLPEITDPKLTDYFVINRHGTTKKITRRVRIDLVSELLKQSPIPANTEVLSADRSLTDADAVIQYLDPGGAARDVPLPTPASTNHPFVISNRADADETLTVYDGATAVDTVGQGETKLFVSDGLAWAGLSGGGGGGASPLTTKGDIWGYGTENARIAVGANGNVLAADSSEPLGVKWITPAGGGGGDLLSNLVNAEVSISAETTLTSAAFGKMHVISGLTENYPIFLPDVTGNAGKIIGFRVGLYSAASKLYTLTRSGGASINGTLTRVLHAEESAILLCTGWAWYKIAGLTIPFTCKIDWQAGADPDLVRNTVTALTLNTAVNDPFGMAQVANNRINCLRTNVYMSEMGLRYYAHTAARNYVLLDVNGVSKNADEKSSAGAALSKGIYTALPLVSGDYVSCRYFHNAAADVKAYVTDANTARPYLSITEIPSW
jgi:hypothetical protein